MIMCSPGIKLHHAPSPMAGALFISVDTDGELSLGRGGLSPLRLSQHHRQRLLLMVHCEARVSGPKSLPEVGRPNGRLIGRPGVPKRRLGREPAEVQCEDWALEGVSIASGADDATRSQDRLPSSLAHSCIRPSIWCGWRNAWNGWMNGRMDGCWISE